MRIPLLLATLSLLLINCTDSEKKNISKQTEATNPYIGNWTRSFAMSEESTAQITYSFFNDSISYEMKGPMQLNYTIKKDTFIQKENRWIGDKDGKTYVIFIKNTSKDKITLLKMQSKSIEDALKMPFPTDTTRSKFSSWNTYLKK